MRTQKTDDTVADALIDHIRPLIGGTIINLGIDDQSEDDYAGDWPWHCLLIKCKDTKIRRAWVNRDPEGNGSGHLDIEEA